jgi:ribose transport system substrate-binding protein
MARKAESKELDLMKPILGLIFGSFAMLFLQSCKPAVNPSGPVENRRLFGISMQTLNNPFFTELNNGIRAAVEARGGHAVTLDAQFNSLKQKNDVSDLLNQRPAAIFLNPVNWEGVKGILIEARRKQVPVIVVDAPVSDPDLVLCQVASDNFEAGRMACQALARSKPQARVVVVHLSLNRACIDRVAGFKAEMAGFPGMKVLDIQEGRGSTEGARPVMRDLLGRFPELDAVFAINDPSALGCISAVEAAGRTGQVSVVSVDGSKEALAAIADGRLLSTSGQSPGQIGCIAVEKAYAHLQGESVEKEIKVPVQLITKENLAVGGQ